MLIKDSRNFFILPQAPEEAGSYTYGTPGQGQGQYAHPKLMSLIFTIENLWSGIDNRKIGIGNISLADGERYRGHATHRSGLEVDIRPLRKDGKNLATTIFDSEYDRQGTDKLIQLFFHFNPVRLIYFNDHNIGKVSSMINHDDHFHVKINP